MHEGSSSSSCANGFRLPKSTYSSFHLGYLLQLWIVEILINWARLQKKNFSRKTTQNLIGSKLLYSSQLLHSPTFLTVFDNFGIWTFLGNKIYIIDSRVLFCSLSVSVICEKDFRCLWTFFFGVSDDFWNFF